MNINNVTARKSPPKGAGVCPQCGRGKALVNVVPRPTTPGEVTTYCRWPECGWSRVRPEKIGTMPNKPRTPHRTIRIDDDLWKAAQVTAESQGKTLTEVIRAALVQYVKKNRSK